MTTKSFSKSRLGRIRFITITYFVFIIWYRPNKILKTPEFIRGYSTVVMKIGNIMLKWSIYIKLIILAIVDAVK